jgi:uncharacterized protein
MKNFNSLVFVAATLTGFSSCTTAPTKVVETPASETAVEPAIDFPIIDAHIHTRFSGESERTSKIPMTRKRLEDEMKDAGVKGAIAHTHENEGEYEPLSGQNIFHCYGLDKTVDSKRLERGLKSGKYRCIKIYLGYVHQYASDPNYQPAYRLAEKYNVPVVFHTGDTYSVNGKLKYADPLTIDEVAVDHRKVKFVIAHCGNPWIQSAAEVAYKNPNVYLDGSALLIGDLSKLDQADVDEYVVKPLRWIFGYVESPDKLMYGTDWPLTNMKPYIEAFKKAIPREHWRAVFYENAKNVFRFPDLENPTKEPKKDLNLKQRTSTETKQDALTK